MSKHFKDAEIGNRFIWKVLIEDCQSEHLVNFEGKMILEGKND